MCYHFLIAFKDRVQLRMMMITLRTCCVSNLSYLSLTWGWIIRSHPLGNMTLNIVWSQFSHFSTNKRLHSVLKGYFACDFFFYINYYDTLKLKITAMLMSTQLFNPDTLTMFPTGRIPAILCNGCTLSELVTTQPIEEKYLPIYL